MTTITAAINKGSNTGGCRRFCRRGLPALCLLVLLLTAGCLKLGPDYRPAAVKTRPAWGHAAGDGLYDAPPAAATLANWWQTLLDPQLTELEARAVRGNLDLQQARARIREARALRGISKAGLFPTIDAGGSFSDRRSSENYGRGDESRLYAAGFDASWELDVFGGRRRAIEAAQAELEASREGLRDVLVSLLAEVALNYVEVRLYQARLQTTRENIALQEKTYRLNRSRRDAGLIDKLSLEQSRYNLEYSRSLVPTLETGLEAAKNRLAVLLGEPPGTLHAELEKPAPIPRPLALMAVGIPADTLRRRPDVRRAERRLAAATARIGAATAELWPKFYLGGTIGLEATAYDDLWEWASRAWNLGPRVSWNIFDAGAIRQYIQVQNARQEQALAGYQQTVLRAQEEVENALVAYAREQQRRESLAKASRAAARALRLAEDQYQAGLADFLNVLETQRSLLAFQDELHQASGQVAADLIRLYKALGGGWQGFVPPPAGEPLPPERGDGRQGGGS